MTSPHGTFKFEDANIFRHLEFQHNWPHILTLKMKNKACVTFSKGMNEA